MSDLCAQAILLEGISKKGSIQVIKDGIKRVKNLLPPKLLFWFFFVLSKLLSRRSLFRLTSRCFSICSSN